MATFVKLKSSPFEWLKLTNGFAWSWKVRADHFFVIKHFPISLDSKDVWKVWERIFLLSFELSLTLRYLWKVLHKYQGENIGKLGHPILIILKIRYHFRHLLKFRSSLWTANIFKEWVGDSFLKLSRANWKSNYKWETITTLLALNIFTQVS